MNLFPRLRPLALPGILSAFVLILGGCSRRGNLFFGRSAWGIFILVLDIVALLDIFKQPWELTRKLIWTAVILLLPVLGLILYYLFSGRHKA